ncbi:N-acetylgalactosamine 6-sulfate sulfatase [Puteibacter caeruleilacunae]|nr:N-acetylgalactosamine 6-sulfate sulfatase [Puteibacter caeruleilacunae]
MKKLKNKILFTLGLMLCFVAGKAASKERPNILFILIDDLGKEWVHTFGSDEKLTPNLDKLASTGVKFNNVYSCPQCTPTRVTLMTGQYPYRHGWINHWDVPRWGGGAHFDPEQNPAVARQMRDAGYSTCIAGKWQVNDFRMQPDVLNDFGFDDYCMWTGYEAGNKPSGKRYWDPYIHTKEGSKTYKGQFGDEIFSDFIVDFMRKHKEDPFFIYYPMALTHGPLTTTPLEPNVEGKVDKHRAMVRYTDYVVKKFTDALEEMGLRENTIIVWTTDNGTSGSLTGPLNGRMVKGGKGKTIEPGIDAPFIVNCPGLVPEGVVSEELIDFSDMFPTFVDLAGGKLPAEHHIDGVSAADLFLGKTKKGKRDWILAMGSHPAQRLKNGRIANQFEFRNRVIKNKQYKVFIDVDRKPIAFYDLEADPAEENNLIDNLTKAQEKEFKKLVKVLDGIPEKDANPHYTPLPDRSWYVEPGWGMGNKRK